MKDFRRAKARLAPVLDAAERRELAARLAAVVIAAAAPLPCFVVCEDTDVALFAIDHGAEVIWRPGTGLNGAVSSAVEQMGLLGFDRVIVAHSDLPLARDLAPVADFDGVTLVPDRHQDGTNCLCLPPSRGFEFAYGAGSFHRHVAETERLGLPLRVLRSASLGCDIDVPDDLAYCLPEQGAR